MDKIDTMPKARVIVTEQCTRHCALCSNRFTSALAAMVPLRDVTELLDCTEISITGGEPLLVPARVGRLLARIYSRRDFITPEIWLYTSIYRPGLIGLLPLLDGVQFTIHADANEQDIADLKATEETLWKHPDKKNRNNRLKIEVGAGQLPNFDIDPRGLERDPHAPLLHRGGAARAGAQRLCARR